VQDMAARVLANGGEPNYTTEKLTRAFPANVRALVALGWNRGQIRRADRQGDQPMTSHTNHDVPRVENPEPIDIAGLRIRTPADQTSSDR
jgi:hypothetical protein